MSSFKTILVPFGGQFTEMNALETGFIFTKLFLSKVQVLHVSPDPNAAIGNIYQGVSTPVVPYDIMVEQLTERNKIEQEDAKRSYHKIFDQYLSKNENKELSSNISFQIDTGSTKNIIANKGRLSDLIYNKYDL